MKKKRTIQKHHITYEPERCVYIFKGEHEILTKMQLYCRKSVSKGFITALRHFLKERAKEAINVRKEYNEQSKTVKKSKASV